MNSTWRPGDLALTTIETFGLRKLYKRVTRKYRGETYIEKMLHDLALREDEESRQTAQELRNLVMGPYFYESSV